jgi:hypothetical protein
MIFAKLISEEKYPAYQELIVDDYVSDIRGFNMVTN